MPPGSRSAKFTVIASLSVKVCELKATSDRSWALPLELHLGYCAP